MNAYLYSPTGVKEYDPSFSPEDTDIPFIMHEPPPEMPDVEVNPQDDGEDITATLARYYNYQPLGFTWYTHSGEALPPEDMATPHLFYALRMVWNHSVPTMLKVGDGPAYPDVPRWSADYRRDAINALSYELAQRDGDELAVDQRMELFEMIQKTVSILLLGL